MFDADMHNLYNTLRDQEHRKVITTFYRIAICDDNPCDIEYVTSMVREWAGDIGVSVDIFSFGSAEEFLFEYDSDKAWDIMLLDIEMGGINGVSMAKRVRSFNKAVQIVFITGYTDYISEGYDVAALHYLVKPVDPVKLKEVLDRAAVNLKKNERTITVSCSEGTIKIPLYEIRYLEVIKNYVTIHAQSDYTVRKTLSEFDGKLDDGFYRIGRSFIVNLKCIRRVTRSEVYLSDGTALPLPRGHYDSLNRAIINLDSIIK